MMTTQTKIQRQILETKERVEALEHQHYINACSDNFYHTSGRYKEMQKKIEQERNTLSTLKQLKEKYYGA